MAGNSNSGRPKKPPFLHLASGNSSKSQAKSLMSEMEAQTFAACEPPMPDWLSDQAQAEWRRVVPDLLKLGWVHHLDMMALTSYCEAVADYRRFRELIALKNQEQDTFGDVQTFSTGAKQISVWRQLANDAEKRANAAGALFGMSPIARRNLKHSPAPQPELFPNETRDAANRFFS